MKKSILLLLCIAIMVPVSNIITKANAQTPVQCNKQYEYKFFDSETTVIQAEIKGNDVVLQFDRGPIEKLSFGYGFEYCLPDTPVKVENIKGVPRSVFIADIGQDYNPILCILLENGDVQILNLFGSVRYCDLKASEVLFHNVDGFREGGGGPYEDEFGETSYEYATIYAISGNKEYEIDLFIMGHHLIYTEPTSYGSVALVDLLFTDDWKINYALGWEESELLQSMEGRFWTISEDYDDEVFRCGYEFTKQIDFDDELDENNDLKVTIVSLTGVVELRYVNRQCIVTPIEGIDFAGKGMNVPVAFKVDYSY